MRGPKLADRREEYHYTLEDMKKPWKSSSGYVKTFKAFPLSKKPTAHTLDNYMGTWPQFEDDVLHLSCG
eukprot:980105-Amphidinium_carterae.1